MTRLSIIIYTLLFCLGITCTCNASGREFPRPERIYFNPQETPMGEDAFHIKVGEFEWIETSIVHRDATGFFTYSFDVITDPFTMAYEKQWKCPYCNRFWPIGKPCGNADCPSRYKH